MKIIPLEQLDIDSLVADVQQGKTVVYPTETCYGLGCDATNAAAVERIFAIKQRQKHKSVLVVVPHVSMIMDCIVWTPTLQRIADTYWPGPLTVVVPIRETCALAPGVVADDATVAFRVTNHPLAYAITSALGKPIVSTSANISSQESPYDIEAVLGMFREQSVQPDICIDAGSLPHQSPSTIIKLTGERIEILRQGELLVQER